MKIKCYSNFGFLRSNVIPLCDYKGETIYFAPDHYIEVEPYNIYGSEDIGTFDKLRVVTIDVPHECVVELFNWIFGHVEKRGNIFSVMKVIDQRKR